MIKAIIFAVITAVGFAVPSSVLAQYQQSQPQPFVSPIPEDIINADSATQECFVSNARQCINERMANCGNLADLNERLNCITNTANDCQVESMDRCGINYQQQ